ncbi:MAG TPA: HPr family phosphocarrier protein [Pyrinomonadaceae bacterium]|jgi:phosphotransferase system HPr (HPr) family protein|nr:HPr family phosphocarrier protein [Pyrinomonadaceae bacterium]
MLEKRIVIVNRLGLHARAAAKLVRTASAYRSGVRLERTDGGAVADAKSILSVLLLAASRGTELRLMIEGADEAEAMSAVCDLIVSGFGEEQEA